VGDSSGWRVRDWCGVSLGEAGDGAAGDVFVGDGRHVGTGDIFDREAGRWLDRSQPADSGGQDEPFGEGVYRFA